ncbi:hypothetical protein G6045_20630 [Streptomyces sp. YC504]|uniref:DUF3558 domain-containing protein n=1 Tax=Streptomyces mesophilus TaxID=1775132 RepID=A0A6G4XKF9_9ACTN|nr:hypothetical protein [Streptomyces mesophilus]NGO78049.1 hypothetical protein [Streptomyces mesophilus]
MNSRSWLASIGIMAVIASASGCTSKPNEPTGLSASEICDGTLDSSSRTALEKISGSSNFEENYFGTSEAFTLDRVVKNLHSDTSERATCYVSNKESAGKPLLDIDFEAVNRHPSPDPEGADRRNQYEFPMGEFAIVGEQGGATLFFSCPNKGDSGTTQFVKATLFTILPLAADEMTILNSVSRRLADKMGCADVANLPAKVPAPTGG